METEKRVEEERQKEEARRCQYRRYIKVSHESLVMQL
jgi:hypothetical protein